MARHGTGEHLVFAWSPAGYTLDVRQGAPPSPGALVVGRERRYRVTKLASSPLPRDRRSCVYLLPARGDGEEPARNGSDPVWAPVGDSDGECPDDLQRLLDRCPEGACVVAVDAGGRRTARTVTSLVTLSVGPPLVGFAVSNDEPLQELLPDAGGCAISLLAGGQQWLADHYTRSGRPVAMWSRVATEVGAAGAPLFVGALGWLECALLDSIVLGAHTFFVCEVRRIEAGAEASALVRVGGDY
ncbi:MAG: flavin reductase family protein, partial [Gaiellaceae bacterium]